MMMKKKKQDIAALAAFFLTVFLFSAVIIPIAIDRELDRQDAVAMARFCQQKGACHD